MVVAIQKAASESDPFRGVEPQRVTFTDNGQQYSGWRYRAAMIEHFERSLFPAFVRAKPDYAQSNRASIL